MKKFFFLMMAMAVVLFSSCQEREEIRFKVCSRNGNNSISGWVTCGVPVSSLSTEDINKLAEDVSTIAETPQSPREIRSQIQERIHKSGGSDISFRIKMEEKTIQRDADAINSMKAVVLLLLLLSPAIYRSCFRK